MFSIFFFLLYFFFHSTRSPLGPCWPINELKHRFLFFFFFAFSVRLWILVGCTQPVKLHLHLLSSLPCQFIPLVSQCFFLSSFWPMTPTVCLYISPLFFSFFSFFSFGPFLFYCYLSPLHYIHQIHYFTYLFIYPLLFFIFSLLPKPLFLYIPSPTG